MGDLFEEVIVGMAYRDFFEEEPRLSTSRILLNPKTNERLKLQIEGNKVVIERYPNEGR